MIVLFLVESSGTSTWRRPSSTLTQPMGFTPPTPWALSTVLNAIRCLLMGIHDCLSMVIQAKKIHPEKKNGPHSQETSESGFDLHYMKYVVPPPTNLTYIQVPKIAIFERRIHFLQGPWFLGYPSWISGMFSASFSTHFFIPVSGASKRNRFQGASTGQRLD